MDEVVEVDPTGRRVCGPVVLVVDADVFDVEVVEAGEVDVDELDVDEVDVDDVDVDELDVDEVDVDGVDVDGVDVDGVVVEVEDVDVDVGPAGKLFTAGENPRSADKRFPSFPSMPRAQMPIPPTLYDAANCAASYNEVGTSKKDSCHWVPTRYDVQPVWVVASQ